MKINYKGYVILTPTSGGKAGTGRNKTSNVQVRKNNVIVKQFRFTVLNAATSVKALSKARKFVDEQQAKFGST